MYEDCHLLGKARRWKRAVQEPGPETPWFIAQHMADQPDTAKKSHVEIQQPETLAERDRPGHTYSCLIFRELGYIFHSEERAGREQIFVCFVLWEKSAILEFVFHSESGNTYVINCNSKIV